jgi:hypothetical protein
MRGSVEDPFGRLVSYPAQMLSTGGNSGGEDKKSGPEEAKHRDVARISGPIDNVINRVMKAAERVYQIGSETCVRFFKSCWR